MTFSVNGNTVITSDRIVQLTTGATGSRPASPVVGQMFFDTTLGKVIVWNGAVWRESRSLPAAEIPSAWAWGYNAIGHLGDNTTTSRFSPVSVVGGFTDWVQISAGDNHTAALRVNGTAWAWGFNLNGRLGDGTTTSRRSPVSVVGGFTDWVQISAGGNHTAALRVNGTAWAWGLNTDGQLGDNTTTISTSPVSVVGGFTDWIQISTGYKHTAAIRTNGTAWGWGLNSNGQLGDSTTTNRSSPVSVIGGFTDWIQVSAATGSVHAIRANGTLWSWGAGQNGRLGDNTIIGKSSPVSVVGGFTDWIQVSAGPASVLALRANGTAWAWGYNGHGRLGDGTTTSRLSPVSVIGGFTDWIQISAGGSHTTALRANGTAWAWGRDLYGQLGDGTPTPQFGGRSSQLSPVSVAGGFTDWVQVDSGGRHSSAIRSQPRTQTVRPTNQRNTLG